jgi:myo-inositol-1(or 4)-monophosphatase
MNPYSEFLDLAVATARKAGANLRLHFGSSLEIAEEHRHDIKLRLDVENQTLIQNRIHARFPDHHFLGEEGEETDPNDGGKPEWIVDPIDGTVNFAYGIPHFCVSIALRDEGRLVVGAVYDPMRDEMFSAASGAGASLNGKPIRVSERKELERAILALGFSKSTGSIDTCMDLYGKYAHAARKLRAMGSAALDMAYVAAARMDAYIEQDIKIWDIAAGTVLIEEAGGRVESKPSPQRHHYYTRAWNGRIPLPF